jgi:hypothetical protein
VLVVGLIRQRNRDLINVEAAQVEHLLSVDPQTPPCDRSASHRQDSGWLRSSVR